MDPIEKARMQVRLVVITYRQHLSRTGIDGVAAFRERALPILRSVEVAYGQEPEIARLLGEARRELEG